MNCGHVGLSIYTCKLRPTNSPVPKSLHNGPMHEKKIRKFNFADQINVMVGVKYLLRGILLFLVHEPSSSLLVLSS